MKRQKASIHHSSFACAERSHSGLVHRSRKPEWVKAHRGFESHPLRHDSFKLNSLGGSWRVCSFLTAHANFATWREVGAPSKMARFPSSRLSTATGRRPETTPAHPLKPEMEG